MIRLIRKLDTPEPPWATLTLPWAARTNSRLRVLLDNGKEADICLEDDGALRNGDLLASDEGHVVRIHAASEPLSTATCADARTMARLCYHLGSRQAEVQIAEGQVRYRQDPVLDDMVRRLGFEIRAEQAPFEPETDTNVPT